MSAKAKNVRFWAVSLLRLIAILPFWLLMVVGDYAEEIFDWLSAALPSP